MDALDILLLLAQGRKHLCPYCHRLEVKPMAHPLAFSHWYDPYQFHRCLSRMGVKP
jgi:hypothetical protein